MRCPETGVLIHQPPENRVGRKPVGKVACLLDRLTFGSQGLLLEELSSKVGLKRPGMWTDKDKLS